ncbi:MAG TPA: XRE family transcriptional regulator [Anaerolineales bacterium]|nr:XRE family transcriptional regulator [Anaerolineales bacterium]
MSQYQHKSSTIFERLLAIRRRAGLSQKDFSKKIGISPRAYRNYELAIRDVPLAVVVAIHAEFDVGLNWLVLGEGKSEPQPNKEIILQILSGLREYQEKFGNHFPLEKEARIFNYLFTQFASGKTFTGKDIHSFLETAS